MIERWKKLGNIKCQSTCLKILNLFWPNKIGEKNAYICSQALFETSKLIRMVKVIRYQMKLKSFTNDFLN